MVVQTIPARIRWAVELMDVQPADHVLEIGCGPGAGAELICSRLETGKLFAIDRSESGVDRTKRRNAQVRRGRPAHRPPDRPGHAAGAGEAPEQGLRLQRQPVLGARLPRRDRPAARAGAPGRGGLPVLRGQPGRAGAHDRAEGLRRAVRGRLPGLGRGAEGAGRRRASSAVVKAVPLFGDCIRQLPNVRSASGRDRGGSRDRCRPDRGPARQPHQ